MGLLMIDILKLYMVELAFRGGFLEKTKWPLQPKMAEFLCLNCPWLLNSDFFLGLLMDMPTKFPIVKPLGLNFPIS